MQRTLCKPTKNPPARFVREYTVPLSFNYRQETKTCETPVTGTSPVVQFLSVMWCSRSLTYVGWTWSTSTEEQSNFAASASPTNVTLVGQRRCSKDSFHYPITFPVEVNKPPPKHIRLRLLVPSSQYNDYHIMSFTFAGLDYYYY